MTGFQCDNDNDDKRLGFTAVADRPYMTTRCRSALSSGWLFWAILYTFYPLYLLNPL